MAVRAGIEIMVITAGRRNMPTLVCWRHWSSKKTCHDKDNSMAGSVLNIFFVNSY